MLWVGTDMGLPCRSATDPMSHAMDLNELSDRHNDCAPPDEFMSDGYIMSAAADNEWLPSIDI